MTDNIVNKEDAVHRAFRLGPYTMGLAIVWTVIVGVSLVWNLHEQERATTEVARALARAGIERDLLYRRWSAIHGGVYAPVAEKTRPNPHLDAPERDIETPAGRMLTLVNPAYMTRQVHELGAQTNGIQGHITSLKPIRPENAADPWENAALEAFERGETERSSIEVFRGKPHLRLMRPFVTEKGCLKCHAAQGYQEGDIRGGVSVSVPMTPLWAIEREAMFLIAAWHGGFWILGLAGIGLSYRHLRAGVRERDRVEGELRESNARFDQLAKQSRTFNWEVDAKGRYTYVSHTVASVLGYKPEEIVGRMHFYDLHPEAEREAFKAAALKIVARKEPLRDLENQVETKTGQLIWVSINGIPVLDGKGDLLGYRGNGTDITERKQVEAVVLASEKKHRLLVENALSGIAVHEIVLDASGNPIDYTFLDANPAFEKHTGLRVADIFGRRATEVLPGIEKTSLIQNYGKVVLTGESVGFDQFVEPLGRHYEINAYRVSEGRFATVFTDITERKRAEERLQQRTTELEDIRQALIDQSELLAQAMVAGAMGTWHFDAATGMFTFTDAFYAMFRTTAEAEGGHQMSPARYAERFIPPAIREVVAVEVGAALSSEDRDYRRMLDHQVIFADGSTGWIQVSFHLVRDAGGNPLRIIGVNQDITARKEAEEKIKETSLRLSLATKAGGVGVWDYDVVHNRLEWDDQMYALYGVGREDFGGAYESWRAGVHPEDIARGDLAVERALHGEKEFETEFRVVWPDGTVRHIQALAMVLRDDEGKPLRMIGTNWDITSSRQAAISLKNAHTRTRILMKSVQAGIVLVRRSDRVIVEANPAAAHMAGVEVQDLVGKLCNEYICPAQTGRCPVFDLGQEVDNAERTIRRADGTIIPILKTVTRVNLEGEEHLLETFVDITDRKKAERDLKDYSVALESANKSLEEFSQAADDANRAKSEFLANMSHEIRTPMTAILGFSDVLLGRLNEEDNVSAAATIKRNGEYLLELINDILDLSKIEAGKYEIERIACSPSAVVGDVASLMRVRAEAKGLPFQVEYSGAIPETILCDPTRLRQILINLVGNAIKFTETGSVRLLTRFVRSTSRPPCLQFDVIDTGVGMTTEQASKLFQPFTQADSSTTRKFGGTGLGLTISKRLSEMLGGNITISTEPGKGSTFSLTVETGPLEGVSMLENVTEAVAEGRKKAKTSAASSVKLACRILLAEDGPDNQRLIAFLLTKAGAQVTVAENGQIAYHKALAAQDQENPFDVILMDMQMPVMDGYTAAGKLRDAGYSAPIIALTANAMAGDEEKCREAGCDGYATKPIERAKLLDTIAHFLGQNCSASEALAGNDG